MYSNSAIAGRRYMTIITKPEEFLGFRVGEDRKLAGWKESVGYFQLLDAQSDRVAVEEIGRSTENHPFILCIYQLS